MKTEGLLDFLKLIFNIFITELSLCQHLDTLPYLVIRRGDQVVILEMFVLCYHSIMARRHRPLPPFFEEFKPLLLIITHCLLSTFTKYTFQKGRLLTLTLRTTLIGDSFRKKN